MDRLPLCVVLFICLLLGKIRCETENSENTPYDVIVVGLGASGVSALSALARAGRRVLGLEAAGRIGGRVNTVTFGTGVVEVGAEWIHGERNSPTYELAVANNVSIVKQDFKNVLYTSSGTPVLQEITDNFFTFISEAIDNNPEEAEPFGQYLTRRFYEHFSNTTALISDQDLVEGFLELFNRMVDVLEASNDWNDISAHQAYEVLEGHQNWSWNVNGYRTLFDLLLHRYRNNTEISTEIKLNKEVSTVKWSEEPNQSVLVKCKDGSEYNASSVIVTVSVGVLKDRHATLFDPKLPEEKISSINRIEMGVVDKIIFYYNTKWWPTEWSSFGFIWKAADKEKVPEEDKWTARIYGFTTPLGSDNVITLWLTGETAKLEETLPEDVVRTKCTEMLRKFLGAEVPEPQSMIRSTWYSNPLTRGSYTHDGINVTDPSGARATLAAPLLDTAGKPKLLFAGEATNVKHYSTVHGAVETGMREAQNIIHSFETSDPSSAAA